MPSYYDPAAVVNPYATGYGYPMAPWGYNIVGQEQPGTQPTTQPTTEKKETLTEQGKAFLKKETFGVKNQNILIGAAIIAGGYLAYEAGWFGGKKHAAGDPRRHRRSHRRSRHY